MPKTRFEHTPSFKREHVDIEKMTLDELIKLLKTPAHVTLEPKSVAVIVGYLRELQELRKKQPADDVKHSVSKTKHNVSSPAAQPSSSTLTPEQIHQRAIAPSIPPTPRDPNEMTTTEKYYDWMANGGGRPDWGPI